MSNLIITIWHECQHHQPISYTTNIYKRILRSAIYVPSSLYRVLYIIEVPRLLFREMHFLTLCPLCPSVCASLTFFKLTLSPLSSSSLPLLSMRCRGRYYGRRCPRERQEGLLWGRRAGRGNAGLHGLWELFHHTFFSSPCRVPL